MPRSACRLAGAPWTCAAVRDEVLGDVGVLAGRDGPADDVAAVDVEDDVEVVVDAALGSAQLGDVPRPDVAGLGGHQLRPGPGRVGGLVAAVAGLPDQAQQPVHRAHRRQVDAFVEQCRPGLRDGLVAEPRAGQHANDPVLLGDGERVRRRRPRRALRRDERHGPAVAVVTATRLAQQRARPGGRGLPGQQQHRGGDHGFDRGSVSALSESSSKSACAFPTISSAALVLASSRSARSARAVSLAFSSCSADFLRRPRRRRQTAQRAAVAGLAPLAQVRGVQPLAAQQHPASCRVGRVVLGKHVELVLGGERPAPRPVRTRAHRPIIDRAGEQICSGERQRDQPVLALCGREKVLPEVSHLSLTHRALLRDRLARRADRQHRRSRRAPRRTAV